jgi:hypothetical protein
MYFISETPTEAFYGRESTSSSTCNFVPIFANKDRISGPIYQLGLSVAAGLIAVIGPFAVDPLTRTHIEIPYSKTARTSRVAVKSRAVPGQGRSAGHVTGVVHCRTEVDRRRPGIESAIPRRNPDIIRANSSAGTSGSHKELQPISSDRRAGFIGRAAQFADESGAGPNVPSSPRMLA